MTLGDRFWSKVAKTEGCWFWTAGKIKGGYGTYRVDSQTVRLAHRLSYEELVGAIPEDLVIDHLCRTPSCVNPAHLEPVTGVVNIQRGITFNSTKTRCKQGHPFSPDNTGVFDGRRYCRTCRRAWSKKYRAQAKDRQLLASARSSPESFSL